MPKPRMIMALAKVMIAAAWADGEVSHSELNSLKDLLFHLPGMTARDWAELDIYMETPVEPGERERLVADLQAALSSPRERDLAVQALENLISADGQVSPQEREVFEGIRQALEAVDVSIFGQVGRLLRGPVQRRSEAVDHSLNRERHLEDFVRNRVFYNLNQHLKKSGVRLDLPESELRKLSLAGGLMARVAGVDREVTPEEFERIAGLIQQHYELELDAAALVAEVAVSTAVKELDNYRLSREFFEATTEEERVHFLNALFAVAAADGKASHEEMEEIRKISTVLKMTHRQFIDAKLTLPRERRAY